MNKATFSKEFISEINLGETLYELIFKPLGEAEEKIIVSAQTKQKEDHLLIKLMGRNGGKEAKELGIMKVPYCENNGFGEPTIRIGDERIKPSHGMESGKRHLDVAFLSRKFNFGLDIKQPVSYDLEADLRSQDFKNPDEKLSTLELMIDQESPAHTKKREITPSYDMAFGKYAISKLYDISSPSRDKVFKTTECATVNTGLGLLLTYLHHKKVPKDGKEKQNILVLKGETCEFNYKPTGKNDASRMKSKNGRDVYVIRKPDQLWVLFADDKESEFSEKNGRAIAKQLAHIYNPKIIPTALRALGISTSEYNPKANYTLAVVDIPKNRQKRF